MNHHQISANQLTMLVSCFITSGAIVSTSKEMVYEARQDALFCYFFPMVYALLFSLLVTRMLRAEERSLFAFSKQVLGKWAGGVVNAGLALYLVIMVLLDLRKLSEFIKTVLLQDTPILVIMFCILALTAYLVRAGIEVLARMGHVYFFLLAFTIFGLPLMLVNEFDVSALQPFFSNGLGPILRGSYIPLGAFSEVLVFTALLQHLPKRDQAKASGFPPLIRGVVYAAFLLTWLAVLMIGTVGTSISERSMYPNLSMVQLIHITDFLDRLDIVLVSLWMPAFIMKICLTYYVLCQCLGSIGETVPQPEKGFALVLLPFSMLGSEIAFESVVEEMDFELHVWPFVSIVLQVCLLMLWLVGAWIRTRKERAS